jgi:hypothetical protein
MKANKHRITHWTKNIVRSGMSDDYGVDVIRKVIMMNVISLVAIGITMPLGILAFSQGNPTIGFCDIALAVILIANLLY